MKQLNSYLGIYPAKTGVSVSKLNQALRLNSQMEKDYLLYMEEFEMHVYAGAATEFDGKVCLICYFVKHDDAAGLKGQSTSEQFEKMREDLRELIDLDNVVTFQPEISVWTKFDSAELTTRLDGTVLLTR